MATIDIFCKTYKGDFDLLHIALETIKRNVTGYSNLILLIPEKDKHDFDTRNLPERTLIHYVDDNDEKGWLRQQVFKMKAHEYCFSDFIMFTDSDCFFDHRLDLQELIADGKPEVLYTDWKDVGDAIVWKEPTSKFLKQEAEWEMMRRNNQVYHRSTLVDLSEFDPNFEEIIMKSNAFSEFNTISSYAYQHEKEKYKFVNTAEWTYVPPHSVQVWSHSSKADGVSELHLREYIRTLESIMKCFDCPIPKM